MAGWQLHNVKLLVVLSLFVFQVYCDCHISHNQFNECKGVITIDGTYLRTSHIKNGQTLNIYPNENGPAQNFQCLSDKFSPPFPTFDKKVSSKAECPPSDRVIVEPLRTTTGCQGTIYQAGYKISGKVVELYRVDADRPQCSFTKDSVMSGAVERSIDQRRVRDTFSELYNKKYDDAMKKERFENQMDRGHLVAADDFLTYDQKAATFKMINVIPQFHGIQGSGGNWYKIEQFVRKLASKNPPTIHVRTGSFGVLELPDSSGVQVKAFLYNRSKFPVPAWMYKLVKNSLNTPIFAVVTSNNPFATDKPLHPHFCTPIHCPSDLKLNDNASKGYTYCCNPSLFNPGPSRKRPHED
ncbi:uncharacterized protein [Drosophila tropicalis]|uniref:uncharacterized protein isoform X2 n=1 Tax=Drosophila tropicalis TaxID=46794 RepID=UPI0035AC2451